MKNKKHFHIDLHLVHSPNAFKSHHCHVRTTVYSILLYHTLFSLQYRYLTILSFLDSTIYIGRLKLRSLTFNFLTIIFTLRMKISLSQR